MNFEEFTQYVQGFIKDFLPEKYADAEVSLQEVMKNNDEKLTGLVIRTEDSNITPTIYLNEYFKEYEAGASLEDLMKSVADTQVSHDGKEFDVSQITDFDHVKDNIRLKLVSADMNKEYLEGKPFKLVEDLAVVYYVDLGENNEFGKASVPITDNLLKVYGITAEELHDIATQNMETLVTPQFQDMESMLRETMMQSLPPEMPQDMKDQIVEGVLAGQGAPSMYILTNEDKMNGAAMLLSPEAMDMVREAVGDDFFILPSSIHECLIVPKSADVSLEALENMVKEVNANEVAPGERLSDHVYEYDAEERSIVRADKAEERRQEKETMQKDVKTAEERAGNPEKAAAREDKADRDEGRVSFKQKLPEMKEKAAEQTKANPVAENAQKKAQEIA